MGAGSAANHLRNGMDEALPLRCGLLCTKIMTIMAFRKLSLLLFFVLLGVGAPLSAFRPNVETADQLIDKFIENHRRAQQAERVKMVTLDSAGNVQSTEVLRLFLERDTESYSLFRVLLPQEVHGTTLVTMMVGDKPASQMIFLPALGEVRDIRGRGQKGSFLGTDFAFEDFLPENPALWNYEREIDETIDGEQCFKIVAVPKDEEAAEQTGYTRRVLWISREDYALVKIDFYDARKNLLKTLLMDDFQASTEEGKVRQPKRALMTNHLKGTSSLIRRLVASEEMEITPQDFSRETLKNWTPKSDQPYLSALLVEEE